MRRGVTALDLGFEQGDPLVARYYSDPERYRSYLIGQWYDGQNPETIALANAYKALDDYEAALREALALSPADRERFAARASRNIRENFSTANMQRQTLEVYDRLTGWDLAARFRAAGA